MSETEFYSVFAEVAMPGRMHSAEIIAESRRLVVAATNLNERARTARAVQTSELDLTTSSCGACGQQRARSGKRAYARVGVRLARGHSHGGGACLAALGDGCVAVLALAIVIPSVLGSQPLQGQAPSPAIVISDVTVIDVEHGARVPRQTVVLDGNRIAERGDAQSVRAPAGARVVDGGGRFLIPGLVDTHVHAVWSPGATPDTLAVFRRLLANGVTSIREASGSGREAELVALRGRVERGETVAPRVYVSGTASVKNVQRYGGRDLRDLVRRLAAMHVDGIKVLHLTRDETLAAIDEAHRVQLPVYGHTHVVGGSGMQRPDLPFGFTGYAMEAVRAGLTGLMHATSATPTPDWPQQPPAANLTPEARAAQFDAAWTRSLEMWLTRSQRDEQALIDTMIARGTWLEPTLVTDDVFAHPERYSPHEGEKQSGMTVWEAWGIQGDTTISRRRRVVMARIDEFVRRFNAQGGLVLAGTDMAPLPGFGLVDELALLVEAGLTPADALRAATLNPARAFGWSERIGAVTRGKLADLVLLDADPLTDIRAVGKIRAVFANGRVLGRPALDSMLARTRLKAGVVRVE